MSVDFLGSGNECLDYIVQVLLNDIADQQLSSVLAGDIEQQHNFHAVVTKNDAPGYGNDLTVVVSKNVRTVTVSTVASDVTVPQESGSDVHSTVPLPDCGEVAGQKPLNKVLDTAALAAALPCASSTVSGSAFAGYNFSTAFTKSETGQHQLIYVYALLHYFLSFSALPPSVY